LAIRENFGENLNLLNWPWVTFLNLFIGFLRLKDFFIITLNFLRGGKLLFKEEVDGF